MRPVKKNRHAKFASKNDRPARARPDTGPHDQDMEDKNNKSAKPAAPSKSANTMGPDGKPIQNPKQYGQKIDPQPQVPTHADLATRKGGRNENA